ncbi:MAG: ankyrin repeat domain-containing protein [Bacteroidales bacterium]|nr:ankyrin repeat domain-containing protein [Bacteroidales bacterium]
MKIKVLILSLLVLTLAQNILAQEAGDADNALIEACKQNKYENVKLLLPQIAGKVNYYDIDGFTALMYASDNGNDSIVQLLLEYGADPNLESLYKNVVPPLTNTVLLNNPRMLDLMLQYNGNPNLVDSLRHYSLLHYAVAYGYLECADVLLYHRANPNQVTKILGNTYLGHYLRTPLQMAVSYSDTIMAQLLIDYGANVNTTAGNITPLAMAVSKNDYPTADFLLRHGADANLPSKQGAPIVYSAIYADSKMSQLLIDHGARLNATDSEGSNLATIAFQYGKTDNRIFFESKGVTNSKVFIPSAVTLSFANEFCRNEYRMGFRVGFHETHFNTLIYIGVSFRPTYKTAFVERSEKSYWQLREKRTMMQLGIEKRLSFHHQRRPDLGAYIGYQFAYCGGKYDGAIDKKPDREVFHSPSVGLYQRFSGIGISSGYRYYGYSNTICAPKHTAEINLMIYFNFYRKKSFVG